MAAGFVPAAAAAAAAFKHAQPAWPWVLVDSGTILTASLGRIASYLTVVCKDIRDRRPKPKARWDEHSWKQQQLQGQTPLTHDGLSCGGLEQAWQGCTAPIRLLPAVAPMGQIACGGRNNHQLARKFAAKMIAAEECTKPFSEAAICLRRSCT